MTNKISTQSKSFAVLFGIAFFGAIFALLASWRIQKPANPAKNPNYETLTYASKAQASEPEIIVDTSQWPEYRNSTYGLKFKHDPKWKVGSVKKKEGYLVIEIDPGPRFDNFKVYISSDDYFALSGVPTKKTQIGGKEAWDLDGQVLGIKDNATYFTFDMGASLSLKPYFQAMVKTVNFEPVK